MNGLKAIAEPYVIEPKALAEELIVISAGQTGRIEFRAGASSRSRVRVDYQKDPRHKETVLEIEFYLEPGACVEVFHMLDGEHKGFHLSSKIRYHLKKHASLNAWVYVGGGDLSCFEQEVLFEEEHGFASFRGLSVVAGHSKVLHKVKADHQAGYCISRQFFKSIASGQSRSVFESLVSVEKGAVKSDSKQLNKNLLLSAQAECISRPELRILADDVACAHGSATGQLSEQELFYLRSRGISQDTARHMMIEGFAGEVLEDVSSLEVKKHLKELVDQKIKELSV